MATATLTSKGQLTLPAEVRAKLRLKAGDRVSFVETEDGGFMLLPRRAASAIYGAFLHMQGGAP